MVCHKGDDSVRMITRFRNTTFRKKLVVWAVVMVIVLGLGLASIPPAKAQFVISSWEYPDEHGQGLEAIETYENSTGSWAQIYGAYGPDFSHSIDWNGSVFIKLRVYSWLNSTFLGLSTLAEGKSYQQHNITVISLGVLIFTQQNITWFYSDDSIDPPLWFYGYEVVLNFLPLSGTVYTVTVTYEIFY